MKKVRLCALLLAATLSVTSMPAVGASAAQVDASKSYAVSQEQVHTAAPVKEAKSTKKAATTKNPVKLGWLKKNNKWYYVTQKGNKTGWAKIDGNKYYFDKKGVMQTGLIKIDGKKYYFNSEGRMTLGWVTVKGKKYFFSPSAGGRAATGAWDINNVIYYFNAEGVLIS